MSDALCQSVSSLPCSVCCWGDGCESCACECSHTVALNVRYVCIYRTYVSDVGSLCTNARHHIGNMAMGECCYALDFLTCAVTMVACDVSGVPVVVSVRRLTGCFPLRKPGSQLW